MKEPKGFSKKLIILFIVIIIIVVIIIGIPFLINLLFKISAPNDIFVAEWDASAFLQYYGTVLAFLSTTFLGILALWQNRIIQKNNDNHTAQLERMERDKNAPVFVVEKPFTLGKSCYINFELKNISQNLALNINIFDITIKSMNGEIIWQTEKMYQKSYLNPSDSLIVSLENHKIEAEDYCIFFKFSCDDKFYEKHTYTASGPFDGKRSIFKFNIVEEKLKGENNNVSKA